METGTVVSIMLSGLSALLNGLFLFIIKAHENRIGRLEGLFMNGSHERERERSAHSGY